MPTINPIITRGIIRVMLDCLGGRASRAGGAGMFTFPCGNDGQMRGGLLKVSRDVACVLGSATGISFYEFFHQSVWISMWIKLGITGEKCLILVDNWRITHVMSHRALTLSA